MHTLPFNSAARQPGSRHSACGGGERKWIKGTSSRTYIHKYSHTHTANTHLYIESTHRIEFAKWIRNNGNKNGSSTNAKSISKSWSFLVAKNTSERNEPNSTQHTQKKMWMNGRKKEIKYAATGTFPFVCGAAVGSGARFASFRFALTVMYVCVCVSGCIWVSRRHVYIKQ